MKAICTLFVLVALLNRSYSQDRISKPVPIINELNKGTLADEIMGWTYSLDGQWVGTEHTITERNLYHQKHKESRTKNSLGIDNFKRLYLHEIYYDKDTLLLLVKLFDDGFYKFPRSKKGWKDRLSLHYFIIHPPEMQLDSLQDSILHQLKFRLVDSGTIVNVSKKKYLKPIQNKMNLMYPSNKYLHLDMQFWRESNTFRFNLFSNHEVFNDLEGTISDLKIKGKSLFGTEQLMNYIYFETKMNSFANLNLL